MAQLIGAEIFVTVGSVEKKNTLKTQFGILEERIFYFRGSSFGRSIKRVTNGRVVNIVVNSLAGDLLCEICKTLARFGRFFEIGMLMSKGTVSPTLPLSTYHISEHETTLPALQTGKTMGKIVVVPHQDDHVKAVAASLAPPSLRPTHHTSRSVALAT
ncbi:hypothetical protein BDV39DRAFT_210540 [Aspergillus sergii]|uniref:Enoyl reductase (ER) domain-containing protein n=1 Tax=Aspergillus sergii TaxID=1034303 RepID=A0A5N6WLG8_9EURO|nr:hypothetical protein BDV39DRAFT_210540 [Aspergillus sergii]